MFDQKTDWLVAHLPGEDDDYLYELTLAAVADPDRPSPDLRSA